MKSINSCRTKTRLNKNIYRLRNKTSTRRIHAEMFIQRRTNAVNEERLFFGLLSGGDGNVILEYDDFYDLIIKDGKTNSYS